MVCPPLCGKPGRGCQLLPLLHTVHLSAFFPKLRFCAGLPRSHYNPHKPRQLSSLLKLRDVKSKEQGCTLLHAVVDQLSQHHASVLADLKSLHLSFRQVQCSRSFHPRQCSFSFRLSFPVFLFWPLPFSYKRTLLTPQPLLPNFFVQRRSQLPKVDMDTLKGDIASLDSTVSAVSKRIKGSAIEDRFAYFLVSNQPLGADQSLA